MFETLDSIDWKSFGYHTYGKHEAIPGEIRNLLSPDEDVREGAREFLLGSQQDFGDIYDTTPHIIPFCLEVLALAGAPGKAGLMQQLSGQGMYINGAVGRSVHMMDLCLQTYQALQAGLDIYLDLLAHGDRDERQAACELLQHLTDDVERLIPALLEQIDRENDEAVQVSILDCLKALFRSLEWPRQSLREQYAPALRAMVEHHSSQRVRVTAARASIDLIPDISLHGDSMLSAEVPDLLASEFLHPGPPVHWSEAYPSIYLECLIQDMARLADPAPLLRLLVEPGISGEQAHLLARGLLCEAFVYRSHQLQHWQEITCYEKRQEGDFYLRQRAIPFSDLKMMKKARSILQAITAADKVWERPTNLFSYFYGLPDSREELRRLAEDQ